MNLYNIGDIVIKDGEVKVITGCIKTILGYVYDTKTVGSNEIEVCFENDLRLGKN